MTLEKEWEGAREAEKAATVLLVAAATLAANAADGADAEARKLSAVVERNGYASEYNAQSARLCAADATDRAARAGLLAAARACRTARAAVVDVADRYTRLVVEPGRGAA